MVDPDMGGGELTVRIPAEIQPIIAELRPFKITIEFAVEKPQGGIQFVVPSGESGETMADRGAHVFTFNHENSTRLCFPCVDSFSEPCTWKIQLTVDAAMTAVSCGDLVETVYTTDLRRKTFHYTLTIPTAAPNIAFAVGPFEILVDPQMHEVTHFCLPKLMPILKHTVKNLHQAFEFYEELLSSRYPYSCYKQVFVDQSYVESSSFATMTIFTTNLLHPPRVIDQVPKTQGLLAQAIAEQFFGTFLCHHSWSDWWLPKGISRYLGLLYAGLVFGNNEYRHQIYTDLLCVSDYEKDNGGIILDHSQLNSKDCQDLSGLPFSLKHPHLVSWDYFKVARIKSSLIIRMIEQSIGRELLLQVFNKLISLASTAAQQKVQSESWFNLLLSTNQFLKSISTVSGKDIKSIITNWVCSAGCARFTCSFNFVRKRNILEIELKQNDANSKGHRKYVGPLQLTVQELDGSFNHTLQVEENSTKHEVQCHSKARKSKKKKIPLITGEEIDMDLVSMEQTDSPILWIRIDSAMTILRQVNIEQPDYQWQYMLRYERDIVAQMEAIAALRLFPSLETRLALTYTIEREQVFYRVRMSACQCLAKVANDMVTTGWQGPPAMLQIFRKMFGSNSCPHIVKQSNFTSFQQYFLQCTMPEAMSGLRNLHNICPPEVLKFLLDLFKYNDNSKNPYSDNYYRGCLVRSLANTVTPAVTMQNVGALACAENLTPEVKAIVEEITRYLNLDKLLPSYRFHVTVACLAAIRRLQKFGHVPSASQLFKTYASYGNFTDVRSAAIKILCDYAQEDESGSELNALLDMAENDPEPYIRHKILSHLIRHPPFSKYVSSSTSSSGRPSMLLSSSSSSSFSILNTESLVHRLWTLLNSTTAHDPRLRSDVCVLYHILYGRLRPSVLPSIDHVSSFRDRENRSSKRSSPDLLAQPSSSATTSTSSTAAASASVAAAAVAMSSAGSKISIEQIPSFLPMDFLQSPEPIQSGGGGGGDGMDEEEVPPKGGGLLSIASPCQSETGDAMHPIRIGSSQTLLDTSVVDPLEIPAAKVPDGDDAVATSSAAEAAEAQAAEQARTEQLMMRQDVSAATLLSPGKGQQGIPLHIPCPVVETPMDLSSGLGSGGGGGGGGAPSSSSGSALPQSPFVEASDNSNSYPAPSLQGSTSEPVAFDSSMFSPNAIPSNDQQPRDLLAQSQQQDLQQQHQEQQGQEQSSHHHHHVKHKKKKSKVKHKHKKHKHKHSSERDAEPGGEPGSHHYLNQQQQPQQQTQQPFFHSEGGGLNLSDHESSGDD